MRTPLPSALSIRFYHFATPLSNQSCGGAGLRGDTRPFPQPSYRKYVSCQKFFDSFLLQLARGLVPDDASDEPHRVLTAMMVALGSRNARVAPRRRIVYHVLVTTERGANGEMPKLPAPFVFACPFPLRCIIARISAKQNARLSWKSIPSWMTLPSPLETSLFRSSSANACPTAAAPCLRFA